MRKPKKRGQRPAPRQKRQDSTGVREEGKTHGLPRAVMEYLRRVGAEVLNFRRAMVKEYRQGNYYTEKTLIRISPDGTISCSRKDHEPTAEEQAKIKGAMMGLEFPRSIPASRAQFKEWMTRGGYSPRLIYELTDTNGNIVMVQERREGEGSRGKIYVPWTLWSDGEWRSLEPDGALPFWRPPEKRLETSKFMIHEGAKPARVVEEMLSDPKCDHPWRRELAEYEHWGMIGGALAPHRADYDALKIEKPTEVVYFCDNDHPGKAALQEVSRHYGEALKGVTLDKNFPESWDLADPMPKALFAGKRFIGLALREYVRFATRATEQVPNPEGKGRPVTIIRRAFKEEWVHSVRPEVFIHRDWASLILPAQEFNSIVAPFSDVDDTARLLKRDAASKSVSVKYNPGKPSGIYGSEEGRTYINTHCPSRIEPEEGDPGQFIKFTEHLVPDEGDRRELVRWAATLIACPSVKMLYGVLLISEMQGIGKGTLGEKILAPLVGEENVSYPSENEIVDSNFNYWLAHKRLAVVHEIYAGHSSKAYNRLKSTITDRNITVNKKYQAAYDVENWLHIFACSNSLRAIQLTNDDRRWFVPKVTEKKLPSGYWSEFNRWLTQEGGLGIILWYARKWVAENGAVGRSDSAPWSEAKAAVVEEGYSPGMSLVANALRTARERADGKEVLLLDSHLVRLIRDALHEGRHSDRLERPMTVRKVAKALGWHIGEHKIVRMKEWNVSGDTARVISTSEELATRRPGELAAEGVRPVDVKTLAGEM